MPSPKPWYHPLSIDVIIDALRATALRASTAALIPLMLRATATPYSHPAFVLSALYALTLFGLERCSRLNHRLAHGAPREMAWGDEVVVVTGGASGLGRMLAMMYAARGVAVAVLDLVDVDGEMRDVGVSAWICDVGSWESVDEVAGEIEKSVCRSTFCAFDARVVAEASDDPWYLAADVCFSRSCHS